MNKLIVEITENNVVELDVKVENDSFQIKDSDIKVRLFIEGDNNCNLSFDAYKSGDSYSISIPRLKEMIKPGSRNSFIEVVCADRCFNAWEGKVDLIEETKIVVTPRKKNNIVEDTKIKVSPKVKVIKNDSRKSSSIDKNKDDVVFEIVMDKPIKKPIKRLSRKNTLKERKIRRKTRP
tara:strand:+ start:1835 stop:2368 length:534 start_codon:yes stop_codon:yes gene_type:complete